jgi:hypothetical protein
MEVMDFIRDLAIVMINQVATIGRIYAVRKRFRTALALILDGNVNIIQLNH